jgi:hypothetical protein
MTYIGKHTNNMLGGCKMKQKIHKIVVFAWLIIGLLLFAWCFEELLKVSKYEGPSGGAFQATLIGGAFAAVIIVSSVGALRRRSKANPFLMTTYVIAIGYGAVYVLLGGIEDTGSLYFVCVTILTILSVTGLVVASSKAVRSKYYKPNQPQGKLRGRR